jgi:septal ring factor EnvC (AmiA/AmiB activator)
MSTPAAGIPEADWLSWLPEARQFTLAQQKEIQALRQENDELRRQLTALATELAQLRERIGRSSWNSSKPLSSDSPAFKPPERRKAVAANAEASRAIPGKGHSRCLSSGWMR